NEGNRIVALGILRANRDPTAFDIVKQAIGDSKSAFEQYQALRVAQSILPGLSGPDLRALVQTIEDERKPGGRITASDPSRWNLSVQILGAIQKSVAVPMPEPSLS